MEENKNIKENINEMLTDIDLSIQKYVEDKISENEINLPDVSVNMDELYIAHEKPFQRVIGRIKR